MKFISAGLVEESLLENGNQSTFYLEEKEDDEEDQTKEKEKEELKTTSGWGDKTVH